MIKLIDEKNFKNIMQQEVEPYLAERVKHCYFDSFDSQKLH